MLRASHDSYPLVSSRVNCQGYVCYLFILFSFVFFCVPTNVLTYAIAAVYFLIRHFLAVVKIEQFLAELKILFPVSEYIPVNWDI